MYTFAQIVSCACVDFFFSLSLSPPSSMRTCMKLRQRNTWESALWAQSFFCIPAVPPRQVYCLSLCGFAMQSFLKVQFLNWRITTQKPLLSHTRHKQEKNKEKRQAHTHTKMHKNICISNHNKASETPPPLKKKFKNRLSISNSTLPQFQVHRKSEHKKTPHQVFTVEHMHTQTSGMSECGSGGGLHVLHRGGGSQVSVGREPQGSPSERCVVHSWGAALRALIHLPEGTKWRTLLVSIAEQVVANAHFLSPTTSPPSQPIMVVLSCADECEITSAPLLCSVSDCLSDTCSDSAPLCLPTHGFCHWVLEPSRPRSLSQPTTQQPMTGQHAARQTERQDTPPQHTSLKQSKP